MHKLFLFLLLSTGLWSCQQGGERIKHAEPPAKPVEHIPAKSREELLRLLKAVDDIDFIFTQRDVSMNVQGAGAKVNISYISPQAAERTACDEVCTMYVLSQGEQMAQIGAFIGPDCAYYAFYENNQITHANAMTQEGQAHFNNILKRVKTSPE